MHDDLKMAMIELRQLALALVETLDVMDDDAAGTVVARLNAIADMVEKSTCSGIRNYFVTFPLRLAATGAVHKTFPEAHPDGYVRIEAANEGTARDIAFRRLGPEWAFIYDEVTFSATLFSRGELAVFR